MSWNASIVRIERYFNIEMHLPPKVSQYKQNFLWGGRREVNTKVWLEEIRRAFIGNRWGREGLGFTKDFETALWA